MIIILLFPTVFIFGQQGIQGIIVDQEEEPVGFVHVTNQTLGIGKVSTVSGRFDLLARRGDSITFSFVGYLPKTIEVNSVHITNYLMVKLSEDSLLLPSITIFSDKYFKVPLNYQGESLDVGIPRSDKEPEGPGSIGGPAEDGVGLTLQGPITVFSKDAREQRKYGKAIETTSKTHYYATFIANDTVRNKLCKIYNINESTFDQILVSAHDKYPGIQRMTKPEQIWNWLVVYFDEVLN